MDWSVVGEVILIDWTPVHLVHDSMDQRPFFINWYHRDGQSLMWFFDKPICLDNKLG